MWTICKWNACTILVYCECDECVKGFIRSFALQSHGIRPLPLLIIVEFMFRQFDAIMLECGMHSPSANVMVISWSLPFIEMRLHILVNATTTTTNYSNNDSGMVEAATPPSFDNSCNSWKSIEGVNWGHNSNSEVETMHNNGNCLNIPTWLLLDSNFYWM